MKATHLLVKTAIVLFTAFQITSCREMTPENEVITAPESAIGRVEPEIAFPGETGTIRKGTLRGNEISYTEIDGKAVFEGDIILTPEQLGAGGNARTQANTKLSSLWRNNTISYTIDASVANKDVVLAAIAEVEAATPVRFTARRYVPITNYPVLRENYVTFTRGRGYSSSIGQVGGEQFITVPIAATRGAVLHEIAHTVGLFHEHTRGDRGVYIKINSNNMNEADLPNVGKASDNSIDPLAYRKFDFGSIMMLDSWAYSKNGLPVMTTIDNKTFTVQREHLSTNDIDGITAMYANIYAGKDDNTYLGDTTSGKMAQATSYLPGEKKIFATEENLFIANKSYLFLDNPKSVTGYPVVNDLTAVKGMTFANKNLYLIDNGYIKRFQYPYSWTDVANLGGQYWLPATSITYAYGFLFVVNGDILFRVSMDGKAFVSMGAGYKGATEMVTLKDKVYLMKTDGKLYKIDPMTGGATLHTQTTFATGAQLTSNGKNLLVTSGNTLYYVGENGTAKTLSTGWAGVTELAAIDPGNK